MRDVGRAEQGMADHDIVAIGTSAGGVEALLFLAARFPPGFPAAIVVTIHLPSSARSTLDEILSRAGPLPAAFADDESRLSKGHIFIAPPGRHLLIQGDRLSLGNGPRENNVRPGHRSDAALHSGLLRLPRHWHRAHRHDV
jgi:two-component system chemotaxis response regulator CheB